MRRYTSLTQIQNAVNAFRRLSQNMRSALFLCHSVCLFACLQPLACRTLCMKLYEIFTKGKSWPNCICAQGYLFLVLK